MFQKGRGLVLKIDAVELVCEREGCVVHVPFVGVASQV